MAALSNEQSINILYAVVAFCYCLNVATLLFVFKLWLDLYHKRWIEFIHLNNKNQTDALNNLKDEFGRMRL